MNNLNIYLTQIPNNIGEDYNKNHTKWVNGRLIEFDEGNAINYYIRHEDKFENNTITTFAFEIKVSKPITPEKIIAAVEKKVYNLYSEEDYNNFQTSLIRKTQNNPLDPDIYNHNKLIRWIDNGLKLARGITIEEAKNLILQEIIEYHKTEIKIFKINNISGWLDKNTRASLINSITIEKNKKIEETVIWLSGEKIILPIDTAINILQELEIYAKQCYNKVSEHKYNISKLTDINKILEYDYKSEYPEKLIYYLS